MRGCPFLTKELLVTLALDFRSRAGVAQVIRSCDLRQYKTGPVLEAYVDVETQNSKAFSWWLEVRWNHAQWIIESSVRESHQNGQDVLIAFPDRVAASLDELVKNLRHTTSDLITSAKSFVFDR